MIEFPPVEPDLLGLVDRADEQPDPNREQFDFRERHLDIARDDESLVEYAIENVDEPTRSALPLTQWRRHSFGILRGTTPPEHSPNEREGDWQAYLSNADAIAFLVNLVWKSDFDALKANSAASATVQIHYSACGNS